MAEIRLIKLDSEGQRENQNTDTTRFAGHTIVSGGAGIVFDDPAADGIKPTAATITADNLMAKERDNTMTTGGAVLFPAVSNVAAQVDAFRLPEVDAAPTAVPAAGGAGYAVWHEAAGEAAFYIWNSSTSAWDNQNIANVANRVENIYSAAVTVATAEAVYIDGDGIVNAALATAGTLSRVIGFARHSAATDSTISIQSEGDCGLFSGLTPQSPYFLDPATSGAITTVLPTASNKAVYLVGYGKTSSTLHIQWQRLAIRT